jgi:hypothetical protein
VFPAPRRRRVGADRDRRLRLDRIEKLGAGDEHNARAGKGQQVTAITWKGVQVVLTALHRSNRNGINDQPRFGARLDCKQAANLAQHLHH